MYFLLYKFLLACYNMPVIKRSAHRARAVTQTSLIISPLIILDRARSKAPRPIPFSAPPRGGRKILACIGGVFFSREFCYIFLVKKRGPGSSSSAGKARSRLRATRRAESGASMPIPAPAPTAFIGSRARKPYVGARLPEAPSSPRFMTDAVSAGPHVARRITDTAFRQLGLPAGRAAGRRGARGNSRGRPAFFSLYSVISCASRPLTCRRGCRSRCRRARPCAEAGSSRGWSRPPRAARNTPRARGRSVRRQTPS